jgi:prepilin-type processing-associated H-X9-DG protein
MAGMTETRTDVRAVISLVLGVLAPLTFGLTSLPALFVGFLAMRQINLSDGRLKGHRVAAVGMALGVAGIVAFVVGIVVVALTQMGLNAEEAGCQNNLRRIGMAVAVYHDEHRHFPRGTIPVEGLAPDERLSWMASVLPYMEREPGVPKGPGHKGQDLFDRLDREKGWQAPENRPVADTFLPWFVCPASGARPTSGEPGVTKYVGLGGVGKDAALLPEDDPRAGFFGYDRLITRDDVTRGASVTMMATEAATANGPWAAGGPATVRVVDPGDQPYIGTGRPFGGLHPDGVNALFADGHVGWFKATVSPSVWEAHATIHDEP